MRSIALNCRANTGIASAADYAECRRIMRAASKNYAFASLVLPPHKRRHVEALYAFLRVGDDRVDVSHEGFASTLAAIEDWEAEYWRAFETGRNAHPVMRAYLNTACECGIPPETMELYFRAMKDDLAVIRYATFVDLLHYMEGSAIPVGRAMLYILGVKPPCSPEHAMPYADSLSIAMQLSNFWRDIGEDWRRGRVYVPQEDLERFGVAEADIATGRITPRFAALLRFEIERTVRYYAHALEGVGLLESGQWGVMSGLRIYRAILTAIRDQGYDVFGGRAGPSLRQRIGHLMKARRDSETPSPWCRWVGAR